MEPVGLLYRCATDTPFPPVPKFLEFLPLTRSSSFCLL